MLDNNKNAPITEEEKDNEIVLEYSIVPHVELDISPQTEGVIAPLSISILLSEYDRLILLDEQVSLVFKNIEIFNDGFAELMSAENEDFFHLLKNTAIETLSILDKTLDDVPNGISDAMSFYNKYQKFFKAAMAHIAHTTPLSKFEGLDFLFLKQLSQQSKVETENLINLIDFFQSLKPEVQNLLSNLKEKKQKGTLPTTASIFQAVISNGADGVLSNIMNKFNPLNLFK